MIQFKDRTVFDSPYSGIKRQLHLQTSIPRNFTEMADRFHACVEVVHRVKGLIVGDHAHTFSKQFLRLLIFRLRIIRHKPQRICLLFRKGKASFSPVISWSSGLAARLRGIPFSACRQRYGCQNRCYPK